MMAAKPGQKIKVYVHAPKKRSESFSRQQDEVIRYGEVLGTDDEGRILVNERSDFATLPVGAFNHFRYIHEVIFLNPTVQRATELRAVLKKSL
jgi:hypothetical protein